jgi:HK97 family phage major capsid protein
MEANNAKPGAIILHPRDWANLKAEKDQQQRYMLAPDPTAPTTKTVFGIPVFVTSQIATTETQRSGWETSID